MRDTVLALLLVLLAQVTLAALQLGVPVLAPALVAALGMRPEAVGLIGGLIGFGSVWLFAANSAVTPVLGPLRALIAACLLAVAGAALMLTGLWTAVFVGAVAIGFAYGVTAPAGSQIIARHSPRRLWGTVFSVRQAGVPAGGALAGLIGAGLAAAVDWRAGRVALAAMPLAAAALIAFAPARFAAGASGARFRARALLAPGNALSPFRTMRRLPQLVPIALASLGLGTAHASTLAFLTTYLTDGLGLSLALAGGLYSTMHGASLVGRLVVGVAADWLGSTRIMLVAMAVGSAAALVMLSLMDPGWGRPALFVAAGLAGVGISTWNGLYLAEVARLAPPAEVAEATAAVTFCTFAVYTVAPPAFAALVWLAGYGPAWWCTAAVVLASAGVLVRGARAAPAE
ncbi:MAG TPA: MFS transporter [Thermohalobaculum sp.]|nr:MFS transporter [Thermohalobaculum sp.]